MSARTDALEEAARECDAAARRVTAMMFDNPSGVRSVVLAGSVAICQQLAASIRALGGGDAAAHVNASRVTR